MATFDLREDLKRQQALIERLSRPPTYVASNYREVTVTPPVQKAIPTAHTAHDAGANGACTLAAWCVRWQGVPSPLVSYSPQSVCVRAHTHVTHTLRVWHTPCVHTRTRTRKRARIYTHTRARAQARTQKRTHARTHTRTHALLCYSTGAFGWCVLRHGGVAILVRAQAINQRCLPRAQHQHQPRQTHTRST